AVMGSKNLKAIAVRGSGRKEIAEPKALNAVAKWLSDSYTETWLKGLRQDGTANGVYQHLIKGLPTKNFQQGTFEGGWEEITGTRMTETILIDRDNCYACPVHCKRVVEVEDDQHSVDPTYGGPEYETIGAFGSSCGVNDLKAIAKANELCNAYGLDTISAGVTIAWAMECYDRGLLTSADTGGIELNFGSADAMVQMVELIAKREGFGDLLAEGSYHAAQEIGRGTGQYVMHAKGQEVPMHEPRVKFALGVGYAVSPTGADHMHNIHDVEYDTAEKIAGMHPYGILEPLKYNDLSTEKMHLAATVIARSTLDNVLGFCMFVSGVFDPDHLVEMVRSITGWDTNLYELLRAGERGYIMARAFNAREGFTAADDKLPERFFQAYTEDPSEDNVLPQAEFDQARKDFYSILGWDHETAAPTEWKLRELGLGWVAEAIR
ncbi:MAG: hypothetical protein JXB38_07955, partial [Anaerolineales bacterium]|nr:hypothetical protein [Anaerolineales bacterium]